MLYKETVEPRTLDLILRLHKDERLKEFNLVGGTALSLQIGHRKSIDIDLFSKKGFDATKLSDHLLKEYKAESLKSDTNSILCFINDIKVDLLSHQYPLIGPTVQTEGVRMVSLEDIGAMKLSAIVDNGKRLKDFVDIYNLLEHRPLKALTDAYEAKYPGVNRSIAHTSLLYHNDIIPVAVMNIGPKVAMKEIADRLRKAIQDPQKIFEPLSQKQQVSEKQKKNHKQSIRRRL